ncbi:MAG: hypothetical protein QM703_23740 [Gemmatales bacterium]
MAMQSEMIQIVETKGTSRFGQSSRFGISGIANWKTTANTLSEQFPELGAVMYTEKGSLFDRSRSGTVALKIGTVAMPHKNDDNLVFIGYSSGKGTHVFPKNGVDSAVASEGLNIYASLPERDVADNPWLEFAGMLKNDPDAVEVERLIAEHGSDWTSI